MLTFWVIHLPIYTTFFLHQGVVEIFFRERDLTSEESVT